jgi:hypothetical protein
VAVAVKTPGGTSGASTFTYVMPGPVVTGISPVTGPLAGGTVVTVTGTNLGGATSIAFGTVAGTAVSCTSSTACTVKAPAEAAGTVDITVTTPSGTSAKSAADHYTFAPAPALTSISPTSGPTSGGLNVTLTGTGLSGGVVYFGSVRSLETGDCTATSCTTPNPPEGAGAVAVTVVTPGGTSNSIAFTVVAPPTVTAVSPVAGPLAGGTTVTVSGTNLSAATSI